MSNLCLTPEDHSFIIVLSHIHMDGFSVCSIMDSVDGPRGSSFLAPGLCQEHQSTKCKQNHRITETSSYFVHVKSTSSSPVIFHYSRQNHYPHPFRLFIIKIRDQPTSYFELFGHKFEKWFYPVPWVFYPSYRYYFHSQTSSTCSTSLQGAPSAGRWV